MTFPRYPAYKDSGVTWLGEVPEHWETWKLSHAFDEIGSGTTPKTEFTKYYEDGDIPWVNTGDLNDGELFDCGKRITKLALEDHSTLKTYPSGSVVIAMYGATIGKLAILRFSATVNQACCVFVGGSIIEKSFLFYCLTGFREQIVSLATGGGQPNISQEILRSLRFACPDVPEQTAIATFLDHETAKIDDLIAEQRSLTALLKEKRQAVISHAVTKGLSTLPRHSRVGGNPDSTDTSNDEKALDSRLRGNDELVPMKDSGVAWLGEVPGHWEVKRIRFVAELNPSKSEVLALDKSTLVSFLPMEAIGEDGSLNLERERPIAELESGYTFFSDGDVTIAKITPCFENGKGAVMQGLQNGFGFGTTELIVTRPKATETSGNYLHWLYISTIFRKMGESYMYGAGGQKRVPDDFVRNFVMALPSLKEQEEITSFLNHQTTQIDTLITETEKTISLLQERRSALISAAVTGKMDVRMVNL